MSSTETAIESQKKRKSSQSSKLSKLLALLLDNSIRIPGTDIRFGIDPIIGLLFPGAGDAVTAMAGSSILLEAAKKGASTALIGKMGINILINTAIGGLPGVGDAFSFWFKSNARNYALLKDHLDKADPGSMKLNLAPVLLFFLALAVALAINIWTFYFMISWIGQFFSNLI